MTVFVVGTGRCGTASIARLAKDAGLEAHHEHTRTSSMLTSLAPAYSHRTVDRDVARDVLDKIGWGQLHAHFKLSELVGILKDGPARFVWAVRNPIDCVTSMVVNGWYRPDDDYVRPGLRVVWQPGGPARRFNYPGNRTRGDLTGAVDVWTWRQMAQLDRCAWWWAWCNRRIGDALVGLPDERLWVQPIERLDRDADRLAAWLGGSPPDGAPHVNVSGSRRRMNDVEQRVVWTWTSEVARRLGYAR